MNDCVNAEMRDQLPELLHERLEAGARAVVLAHVESCADCRAELELLRSARAVLLAGAPRVDVNYVVEALPKPSASRTSLRAPRRQRWADWRIAAAVMVLVAGGTSVAVLNHGSNPAPSPAATIVTPTVAAVPTAANPAPASSATATDVRESRAPEHAPASTAELATTEGATNEAPTAATDVGARLGDLNAQQLQTLLKDIDRLQPVPVTDPDPVTLRVTSSSSSDGEGA